ncbi:hypothetical protein BDW74DRAFT_85071 [Aspergillus multicolor]|uniref:glutathione S-transferase family protein n=1 Tax=Aspergillus multicolor TaxID=41759 RepID=UPI003CCE0550
MAEQTPVHFFDLLSDLPGPSKAWSPNTFKTRLILNYKGIPYTQTYVSYPDIAPLLKSLSVPPHPEPAHTDYTLPTIVHPSVTSTPSGALMDSLPIARHLEEHFPERPIFPSGDASYALAVSVNRVMRLVAFAVYKLVIVPIADILDPRGKEFYVRTRSAMFGKPLQEVRPTDEKEIKEMIEKAKTEMGTIVEMLKGKPGKTGPFFEGDKVGYADLLVMGFLIWFKVADEKIWQELIGLGDGVIKALWDACYQWVEGQGEAKAWEIAQ